MSESGHRSTHFRGLVRFWQALRAMAATLDRMVVASGAMIDASHPA